MFTGRYSVFRCEMDGIIVYGNVRTKFAVASNSILGRVVGLCLLT